PIQKQRIKLNQIRLKAILSRKKIISYLLQLDNRRTTEHLTSIQLEQLQMMVLFIPPILKP
ncbi:hypothetical protein D7X33_37445, partial [Butyricicoccus sp. 1XD8-22]